MIAILIINNLIVGFFLVMSLDKDPLKIITRVEIQIMLLQVIPPRDNKSQVMLYFEMFKFKLNYN